MTPPTANSAALPLAAGAAVPDESGLRLQPSQVVVRNLLRFVDSLPLCYLESHLARRPATALVFAQKPA